MSAPSSMPSLPLWQRVLQKVQHYAELVKLEHTVFALPFVGSAVLLATPSTLWPSLPTLGWVLGAMVGGRTFAMGLNRLCDNAIDSLNPRTQQRPLCSGKVKPLEAWALTLGTLALMVISVWQLPLICRQLLPVALIILTLYSFMKRFSFLCHWVLGLALGSSVIGGWVALSGEWSWLGFLLGLAVLWWVSGFDLLYACLDTDFDRQQGLHSIPAKLGIANALRISRLCHGLAILCFSGFGLLYFAMPSTAGWLYQVLVLGLAGLLWKEQSMVKADDLSAVNEAFFTVNGYVSIGFFAGILAIHALLVSGVMP